MSRNTSIREPAIATLLDLPPDYMHFCWPGRQCAADAVSPTQGLAGGAKHHSVLAAGIAALSLRGVHASLWNGTLTAALRHVCCETIPSL